MSLAGYFPGYNNMANSRIPNKIFLYVGSSILCYEALQWGSDDGGYPFDFAAFIGAAVSLVCIIFVA